MRLTRTSSCAILLCAIFFVSCGSDDDTPTVIDCATSNLEFTSQSVAAACGVAEGSITVSATGGSGAVQFSLNNGSFQATGNFVNLVPGAYSVTARDENQCSITKQVVIESGTSFQASIKSIVDTNCAISGCHGGGSQLPNFSSLSTIQQHAASIKSRTQSGNMPVGRTLTQTEKDLIACWVDDGAKSN